MTQGHIDITTPADWEKLLVEDNKQILSIYQSYLEHKKQVEKAFEEAYEDEMARLRNAIELCPGLSPKAREFLTRLTHQVQIFIAPHHPYDNKEWKLAFSLERFLRIEELSPKGISLGRHVSLRARPVTWQNS